MVQSAIPDIHKNTIMESRNASIFENIFSCCLQEGIQSSMKEVEGDNIANQTNDHLRDQVDNQAEDVNDLRRSKRARTAKSFGPDFLTYMLEGEPRTFHEAVTSPESPLWKEAIKSEIDSIL